MSENVAAIAGGRTFISPRCSFDIAGWRCFTLLHYWSDRGHSSPRLGHNKWHTSVHLMISQVHFYFKVNRRTTELRISPEVKRLQIAQQLLRGMEIVCDILKPPNPSITEHFGMMSQTKCRLHVNHARGVHVCVLCKLRNKNIYKSYEQFYF